MRACARSDGSLAWSLAQYRLRRARGSCASGAIQAASQASHHRFRRRSMRPRPGDWILIGPGDYKTTSSRHPAGRSGLTAGVLISKPNLYMRGMNRNTVIIDGTKPGSSPCSRAKERTELWSSTAQGGPRGSTGSSCGRRTTSGSRTSPSATSFMAPATPATRSGGTAATAAARSAATATTART